MLCTPLDWEVEEWVSKNRRPGPFHTLFIRLGSTVGLHTYCILFWLKYSSLHFLIPLHLNIAHSLTDGLTLSFEGRSKIVTCTESSRWLPAPSSRLTKCVLCSEHCGVLVIGTLCLLDSSGNSNDRNLILWAPLFPVPSRLPGSECGFQYCLLKYVLKYKWSC